MAVNQELPALERFWMKVNKDGPAPAHRPDLGSCWEWQGYRTANGYGRFGVNHAPDYAHRVMWGMAHGPVPNDVQVLHHCDNRACVRPSHLFLGTAQDNVSDMVAKGRNYKGGASNPHTLIPASVVRSLRELHATGTYSYAALGRMFNISATHVRRIVTREDRSNVA